MDLCTSSKHAALKGGANSGVEATWKKLCVV
jgi:hypothetical protein